ncbi:hypothetical protein PG989_001959 [Apiospora arundinis]
MVLGRAGEAEETRVAVTAATCRCRILVVGPLFGYEPGAGRVVRMQLDAQRTAGRAARRPRRPSSPCASQGVTDAHGRRVPR